MNSIAVSLAVAPIVLAVYAYLVYPAILWIMSRTKAADSAAPPRTDAKVTILVPAYNEAAQIRETIESLLAQDYPRALTQVLVISDGSTDATNAIVEQYADRGIELLALSARLGKTAAENTALPHIRGEIVINSDASVRLHPSSVHHLVTAMSDGRVGVASSRDVSATATDRDANAAEAGYVGYEMLVRQLETRTGGIVGASGSGYAIRKFLHIAPVRPDLSRDFAAALTARRHGLRAVSVSDALCYVPRTASLRAEYRRKVRTIARGMATLYQNRELLNPLKHGLFAWKLWSHKVVRWLVPITAPLAVLGLAWLAPEHEWSRWALGLALFAGGAAVVGARWPDDRGTPTRRTGSVLGALAANLAVVSAFWRVITGRKDATWEPTRRSQAVGPNSAVRS